MRWGLRFWMGWRGLSESKGKQSFFAKKDQKTFVRLRATALTADHPQRTCTFVGFLL